MSSKSYLHRGHSALQAIEYSDSSDEGDDGTPRKGSRGTVGAGTRQGTHRSPVEKLAYKFSPWQLQALSMALLVFQDASLRARVCQQQNGRHQNGLVLHRPTAGCSIILCTCDADTTKMADRLGADRRHVQKWWSQRKKATLVKVESVVADDVSVDVDTGEAAAADGKPEPPVLVTTPASGETRRSARRVTSIPKAPHSFGRSG